MLLLSCSFLPYLSLSDRAHDLSNTLSSLISPRHRPLLSISQLHRLLSKSQLSLELFAAQRFSAFPERTLYTCRLSRDFVLKVLRVSRAMYRSLFRLLLILLVLAAALRRVLALPKHLDDYSASSTSSPEECRSIPTSYGPSSDFLPSPSPRFDNTRSRIALPPFLSIISLQKLTTDTLSHPVRTH